MPSLIDTALAHGSVNVAANYLKASPSTNFGTRQLSVLKVKVTNVYSASYAASNSAYSKAVRALQLTSEVWGIYAPVDGSGTNDYFCAIIATDTQWDGVLPASQSGYGGVAGNGSFTALETAIADATGETVVVTIATIS